MKTSHILIGAALVGGALWYREQQKKAVLQQQYAVQQQAQPGALSQVISGLVSGVGSLFQKSSTTKTTTTIKPAEAKYASGTATAEFTPPVTIPKATLSGFYGSLGSDGIGSIGACGGNLGCGGYGSLR